MAEQTRLLILGGTGEAAALADRLAADPRLAVTTSLAGRTRKPAALAGDVRIGGFGGPEGLADYLVGEGISIVVDATHPFAAVISENAARACARTGVPWLQFVRPAWQAQPGDDWRDVASLEEAAALLSSFGRRVFLTIGRQELAAFEALTDHWFLVRMIETPETPLPLAQHQLLLGRGPFDEAAEIALLREHKVEGLVAKNSGGEATYAKIAAARALGLPVIMVARPKRPEGPTVTSIDDALAWIHARLAAPAETLAAS